MGLIIQEHVRIGKDRGHPLPTPYLTYRYIHALLWIRGILVRVQICGSVPLTYGSRSSFLCQRLNKMPTINKFFISFEFLLLNFFLRYIYVRRSSKKKAKKK
jgi:hypothetical protein